MTFAQGRNRLTTHFSESIHVVSDTYLYSSGPAAAGAVRHCSATVADAQPLGVWCITFQTVAFTRATSVPATTTQLACQKNFYDPNTSPPYDDPPSEADQVSFGQCVLL